MVHTKFHDRIRLDRLPPFALFLSAMIVGFFFLRAPVAENSLPYEVEIDRSARAIVTDGENLVTAGSFSRLVKIKSDGEVDKHFGGFAQGFNKDVSALVKTGDGFFVGGDFTTYNQSIVGHFAKLDRNGEIINDFAVQVGTGFDDSVHAILPRKNGNVLVAGKFESYNGFKAPYLVEIDTNGKMVRHFEIDGPVHTIAWAAENMLAIGGDFKSVGSTPSHSFAIVPLMEVN